MIRQAKPIIEQSSDVIPFWSTGNTAICCLSSCCHSLFECFLLTSLYKPHRAGIVAPTCVVAINCRYHVYWNGGSRLLLLLFEAKSVGFINSERRCSLCTRIGYVLIFKLTAQILLGDLKWNVGLASTFKKFCLAK